MSRRPQCSHPRSPRGHQCSRSWVSPGRARVSVGSPAESPSGRAGVQLATGPVRTPRSLLIFGCNCVSWARVWASPRRTLQTRRQGSSRCPIAPKLPVAAYGHRHGRAEPAATDGGSGTRHPHGAQQHLPSGWRVSKRVGGQFPFPGAHVFRTHSVLSAKRARCGRCLTDTCPCRGPGGGPR